MLGVADRAATPLGGIDAAVRSWTIKSEEDGSACRIGVRVSLKAQQRRLDLDTD